MASLAPGDFSGGNGDSERGRSQAEPARGGDNLRDGNDDQPDRRADEQTPRRAPGAGAGALGCRSEAGRQPHGIAGQRNLYLWPFRSGQRILPDSCAAARGYRAAVCYFCRAGVCRVLTQRT